MPELSTLGHVIKAAYEGQPNTNAFTDAEKAKLAGLSAVAASGSFADLTNKPPVMAVGNTVTEARDAIDAMPRTMLGSANGVAQLDGSGKVPLSQMNLEGLAYKGLWDAESNTPTISDGVGEDADFYFASSTATVDTEVRTQYIKSADASHLWVAVYLDNAVMASGQTRGTDSLSYPAALATTGIIPVTAGQKFNIRAWHNADTAKTLFLGGACFINIELFEAI